MSRGLTIICLLSLQLLGSPAAAQPAAVPPPVEQRRTDCGRPQYASDALVCGDPALLAVDAEIAAMDTQPPLAASAIWEDQAAWLRRRSLCAFKTDHRACLVAAYADRRSLLTALATASTQSLTCTGPWQGRPLIGNVFYAGQPLTIRENGLLLGVATPAGADWQPILAWRRAGRSAKLKTQDGRQFTCRPASG